jgi:hypothetical protein
MGKDLNDDLLNIQRQAFAGLLWNRQYYHYDVERWLFKSNGITPISDARLHGRNNDWPYLKNQDIIIMPDKWEYPWYAAWDTAFHCIAIAKIDPSFAKNQLLLIMREWYMNPEGQLPAYEWNFNDVNPPVHAFAAYQIYSIEKNQNGEGDIEFLKRIFQKLIINFTWWANRKDKNENNVFEGGFLGLDNIGAFDRSIALPEHMELEQADGTSWMGMFALNMMDIALELAMHDRSFEDSGTKFYEHFVLIAEALNEMGLWNDADHFFYDVISMSEHNYIPIKVRSIVGLAPLFAVSIIKNQNFQQLKDFKKRMDWFKDYRITNKKYLPNEEKNSEDITLLSLVHQGKLLQLLTKLFDENEFLSENGVRSLSKYYQVYPVTLSIEGIDHNIQYDPADSTSDLYGGNSNWRGPVWMPINFLLIKALEKYGEFYGDGVTIECPVGSGKFINLQEASKIISTRIINIFTKDPAGVRKLHGKYNWFYQREENKDLILFYEYFHGESGYGLGASHQCGWTSLVSDLIQCMDMKNQ